MHTADYKIGMLKRQKLYQQEGKRLISIHYHEKPRLEQVLAENPRRSSVHRRRAATRCETTPFRILAEWADSASRKLYLAWFHDAGASCEFGPARFPVGRARPDVKSA